MTDRPGLSHNILAGVLGAGINGEALRVAARNQTYQVQASAMGASPEDAARVLGEVITELSQTGAPGDPWDIARHRIAQGEAFRPPEELRDAARQILAAGGYSLHPERVDYHAWRLQRVIAGYAPPRVRWYRRAWRWLRNTLRRKP